MFSLLNFLGNRFAAGEQMAAQSGASEMKTGEIGINQGKGCDPSPQAIQAAIRGYGPAPRRGRFCV
jgi:hypothetical protein